MLASTEFDLGIQYLPQKASGTPPDHAAEPDNPRLAQLAVLRGEPSSGGAETSG